MDEKLVEQVDQLLGPYFKTLGDKISAIQTEVKVDVPEPKVTVNVPEVKIPEIKVPQATVEVKIPKIEIPKVEIPPIVVPKPEVTVNVDKVKVENFPEFPAFDDSGILKALKLLVDKPTGASGPSEYKDSTGYATTGLFGNVPMWDDAGTVRAISATHPLPVDIQDASIAVTGPISVVGVDDMGGTISATNFPVLIAGRTDITNTTSEGAVVSPGVLGIDADARPVTSSGYLTTRSVFYGLNGATMDRIRAGVADGTSRTGHLTVQPMMTDGTNYAQLRGTATDGLLVNLGTNNDVTVTATNLDIRDLTSVSDSISAVQSGTWNVTNISGTVSLPTGAATAANQSTIIGHVDGIEALLGTIDTDTGNIADATKLEDDAHSTGHRGVFALGVRADTLAAKAGTDGDYEPIPVASISSTVGVPSHIVGSINLPIISPTASGSALGTNDAIPIAGPDQTTGNKGNVESATTTPVAAARGVIVRQVGVVAPSTPSDTYTQTNTLAVVNQNMLYDTGALTWERQAHIQNAINSDGTGVAAVGLLAQLDDTSPTAITENQFGNVRMSARRALLNSADVFTVDLSATSPSSATTTAQTAVTTIGPFRTMAIYSSLQGATGGTLDVYLQISPDGGTTFVDWAHFPQLAAGAAAVLRLTTFTKNQSGLAVPTVPTAVGTGTTPALAANTFIGGDWGDRIRVVFVAGAGTSAGAAQTIKLVLSS